MGQPPGHGAHTLSFLTRYIYIYIYIYIYTRTQTREPGSTRTHLARRHSLSSLHFNFLLFSSTLPSSPPLSPYYIRVASSHFRSSSSSSSSSSWFPLCAKTPAKKSRSGPFFPRCCKEKD